MSVANHSTSSTPKPDGIVTTAHRPKTPAKSPPMLSPNSTQIALAETNGKNGSNGSLPPRRSSLGFLRRSKSGEPPVRLSKREKLAQQEALRQQHAPLPKSPPRLPDIYGGAPPAPIRTFGGEAPNENGQGNRKAMQSNGVATAMPARVVDPYARTESMTNRGRYSYASSAMSTINSPRRVRRRKDPTPFK
jgi:hypothetical protein